MKPIIVRMVAALAALTGLFTSAQASDWLRDGTKLTEQGTETPWVLTVKVTGSEISVTKVSTAGANTELDFSGAIKDAEGADYTIVSLDGFSGKAITKLVFPTGIRTTGRDAFLNCTSLKTVTPLIPDTITEFGQRTFAGCTALEGEVRFPAHEVKSTYSWTNGTWGWFNGAKITSCDMSRATMTEIVKGSFSGCKQLKWVKLPQGLTTISEDAFTGSSVEKIEPLLPDTVTSFGSCPFRSCSSLLGDVRLTNANATVKFSHHGNNSYGVFQGCSKIASFEMTASITHNQDGEGYVDNNMFNGCSSLGSVVLPANVKGVTRSGVFSGCTSLTNVTFLGWQAPTSFGKNAFDGVTDKKVRVFYPRLSTSWESFLPTLTGYTAMNDALAAEYLANYPNEVLPLGCFKLYNRTVWISDLKRTDSNSIYVVGSPVEADDESAPVAPAYGGYHEVQNGVSKTFAAPPVGVYASGEYRCKGYELCYETAETRVWSDPVKGTATSCTITQADDKVWRLTWLWGPNGYELNTTPMNDGGTVSCSPANTGLYAPDTVVTITATADAASGYQFVCWTGADAPTGDAAMNPVATVKMDAAKEVRAVFAADKWTYDGNKTLSNGNWSLTVSKTGTELSVTAATAYYGGGTLDFSLPIRDADGTDYTVVSLTGFSGQPITKLVFPPGIRTTGRDAFLNCTSLRTVTPLLPDTITEFGQRTFAGCTALEGDVVFPSHAVTSTYQWSNGTWGWFNGSKITSCDMSQATMKEIVTCSFANCPALKWVKLPKGVTAIAEQAFAASAALETVEPFLPDTVNDLGACVFKGCKALRGPLRIANKEPVILRQGGNSGAYQFYNCQSLDAVDISSPIVYQYNINPTEAGRLVPYAFAGCSSLVSITFPENLTHLSDYACQNCTSLTNVYFRGTVPTLGSNVFTGFPSGTLRVFAPKTDTAWTKDFYEANVTPMDDSLKAAYEALYPGEKLPKGQFTWFTRKMWFCLWNPFPTKGLRVILR